MKGYFVGVQDELVAKSHSVYLVLIPKPHRPNLLRIHVLSTWRYPMRLSYFVLIVPARHNTSIVRAKYNGEAEWCIDREG